YFFFHCNLLCSCFLYFSCLISNGYKDLHSFPTRRSSDLTFRSRTTSAERSTSRPKIMVSHSRCRLRTQGKNSILTLVPPMSLTPDRKSTRLNSSHVSSSYAVFCFKKKINICF